MSEQAEIQAGAAGPVREDGRVLAMDVARGFALLGIFCVNIECFEGPFAELMNVKPPEGPLGEVIAHYFVAIFCQGKFYTLFSMLFGMGLVIQRSRAVGAGRDFSAMYLRRLGALCVLGLVHGLLLWYGDILFIYSIAGLILFFCSGFRAKTLAIIAGVILGLATLIATGLTALSVASQSHAIQATPVADAPAATSSQAVDSPGQEVGAPVEAPPPEKPDAVTEKAAEPEVKPESKAPSEFEKSPIGRIMMGFKNQSIPEEAQKNNEAPFATSTWREAETEAFRDGPYFQAFCVRAMIFVCMLLFVALGFGWSVLAMFALGAALGKWGLLGREHRVWHVRFALLGLLVGVPAAIVAAYIPAHYDKNVGAAVVMSLCGSISHPAMALGYAGAMALLAYSSRFGALKVLLANTGRMALTNYLSQTVFSTFIFYHWGLGKFGTWSHAECIGFVFGVYTCQLFISTLWLRHFRFGPVEWLWRSVTYWEWQPMRR